MSGLDNKLSNVIGAKLPQWVLDQISTRSNQNNQDSRDNDNLLYLANKSAWVRLVSSINIIGEDLQYFKKIVGDTVIQSESDLAKQFVLFGGTSKYLQQNSYQQRSGIGKDGAYGILGNNEIQKYGYKPMPGISSVNIETQGRLGSIRAAAINFKCWDKNQLDIIDALYFKLGFTMFLEWGHTYYYPSPGNTQQRDPSKVISTEFFSIDPFEQGLNKEDIMSKISQNSRDSEGNYDAMLGIVTNFNFTYNQDGGYDCTLRLMALGVLADGIKINNPGVLPDILKEEILKLNNTLIQISNSLQQSTSNIDEQNKLAYPECVQKLGNIVTYKGGGLKDSNNKRFADSAIVATVDKVQYYFYKDGRYQTTGFSKSGRYECIDGQLVLDGISSVLGYLNSKINNKTTDPNFSELGKIIQEAGYAGSKTTNINDYNFLYDVGGTRGKSLLFPSFGAILPTNTTSELISSITIDNNYLFEKISNFLGFKSLQQSQPTTPIGASTIPGTQIPTVTSLTQSGLSRLSANTKLESLMFSSKEISDTPGLIRLDINYSGANTKRYYTSLRVKFITNNPQFKKEVLNEQLIYEEVIKKFKSNASIEFKSIGFESRPVVENFAATVKPFGTVLKDTNSTNDRYPVIRLSTTIEVSVPGTVLKSKTTAEETTQITQKGNVLVPATIDLFITDTDLISDIKRSTNAPNYNKTKKDLQAQNQQQTTTAEDQALTQEALSTQISQALNLQSSLEIILRTIQVHALNEAIGANKNDLEIGRRVFINNFWEDGTKGQSKKPFLEQVFSNGVFNSIIRDLVENNVSNVGYTTKQKMDPIQRFKIQAKYGFATNLMANKADISELEGRDVNYKELLRAFVVPYQINQEIIKGTQTNHPVYIPLGLLLLILNHTCTIYDTKKDFQTPLVYVDFNPELNFFLTNTKQLSTNPWKTLIPFEGSFEDYKQLFDPKILEESAIQPVSGSTQSTPLFNPETQDVLSGQLPKLKFGKIENDSVYRGRMMNILLNVDYLVSLVQQYSTKDTINNVYLKPFLEQLLADLNKYLGNFNAFRLSYSDPGNTFQLTDDQFLPATSRENQVSPTNRTELPLVGRYSIAKSLEIKTEVASKLANMLAISANSTVSNKSALSTNGSSYGYINTNYVDRYITDRQGPTGSINVSKELDTIKISAAQFNQSISDFYSKINPSEATVSHATNYYIEKMSKVKNDEYPTRASAMIPVSLNFTTDGISGLAMGQAFTVSDELLPYTYGAKKVAGLPKDHINNVGFVMVGLTHTIENNSWNTAVRANMIFLKDKTEFISGITRVENRAGTFDVNAANEVQSQVIGKVSLSDLNLNQSWENIALDFISSKEGFLEKPKPDEGTLRAGYGTDKIVIADGTVRSVGIDTVFTIEDAKRTLIYQIKTTFGPRVVSQIGQANWDKLNDKQKAALVSYAYNAGSLRNNVVSAIQSNTSNQIVANAIINGPVTGAQSGKVYPALVQRRKEEATLYLS